MYRHLSCISALLLGMTACQPQQATEPVANIGGSGPAHPTSKYRCGDADLAVQLLGESASLSVNDAPPVDLPQQASDNGKTVFSDGKQVLTIEMGQMAWTPQGGSPVACVGG